ncbi:radical SAM superfamily enzyme YgiQ (UPF0313 family) [Methylorubrum pseudosasae]|nr:radical SAM superfamily enzyme YgiQ (UPF0313 family) [Methylorubrum pseudosasae]
MRCSLSVSSRRRILCVFPAYTPSFGTFSHAYPLMGGVKAFMPPQGLLLIAAYMPETWECRFVDENIRPASAKDFAWADAVFVSGMHIQEGQIHDIGRRAHAAGKVAALGGPSVSGAPEKYPDFDYLHVGEIGDATDRLIEILDRDLSRPAAQVVLDTKERLALSDFPAPAYEAAPLKRYLIGSLQFSSGCPYRCEFCDIPQLYGRQPRLKSPEQMCAELDAIISQPGHPAVVYFVDDNFIANRKATREMLPHLVEWQKKNNYPLQFACEATLNMAKQPEILELMRQANFMTVFVGIETPEADALKGIDKTHNAAVPMYEAIETLNSYGLEVTSGIILGLDSDSDKSEQNLIDFIDKSAIPVLTINLLQALPKTPLWDRLQREGRLLHDASLESKRAVQAPARHGGEFLAPGHRPRLHPRAPVRALQAPVRRDLRQPHRHADQGQAHQDQPAPRPHPRLQHHHAGGAVLRLPPAVLAGGGPRAEARADRGGVQHGLRRPPPDPLHPRGAARRAQRVLLRRQGGGSGGAARAELVGERPPSPGAGAGSGLSVSRQGARHRAP